MWLLEACIVVPTGQQCARVPLNMWRDASCVKMVQMAKIEWFRTNKVDPFWPFVSRLDYWLAHESFKSQYAIACMNALTKWIESWVTTHATALKAQIFQLIRWCSNFGILVAIAIDNGTHFIDEFDTFLIALKAKGHWGTPHCPQSGGKLRGPMHVLINHL